MHIVDSQVHIWGADTADRPWPAGRAAEAQKPYAIPKEALLFQMDLARVSRMVLVPPSWEGDRNDLALDAARSHPDRFAVMGRLALQDPASRGLVAGWKTQQGMLGMRFTFHNEHNRHFLTDGSADWLWPAAEKAGIPIMVLVPGSLDVLDRIAGKHPGLKLVIDHVGLNIRLRGPQVWEDLPAVCALAKHPNVAVKASGMPSLSSQPYPFRDLHPHIRTLVEAFGPRRTFWGTDLTRMPCTYYECIALFTEHQPWLAGEDLEWVMGRGVCEWLGWPLPASDGGPYVRR
ncbi:MAG TPA: amidohydrolase family protein [Vicinamibacterales bacterium]|nr:amidohydrolase family protein [Vicinamibacterales bacterium]